jgi:gingipain R
VSATKSARIVVVCLIAIVAAGSVCAAEAVRTRVVSDEGNRIVVTFNIDETTSNTVAIGGDEYQEILIPGEAVNLEKGAPALPHVSRSVIIPDDAAMTIRVLSSAYQETFTRVAPSKGNLLRTVNPADVAYEFGAIYHENTFYPAAVAEIGTPYIMRDFRGVVVRVNPVRYNPATGVLRSYSRITVELTTSGPGKFNVLDGDREIKGGRGWSSVYGAHFLNYDRENFSRYDPINEAGSMLVICHDEWLANMAPFVSHKQAHGIPTTIVGVSTIGNNTTAIGDYIQSVYDTTDLAYVLLVGDAAQVATPQASGGASDPSYTKLAGSDDYPEIIIGRFSANSADEVDTQVERTIAYETQPATVQDWFWKGAGIASDEGAGQGDEGQSDIQHEDEIRGWLLGAGYTEVDQFYEPGATDSQVSAAVNEGRGVINYTGHGSTYAWSTTGYNTGDVDALTNNGMLPFIVAVACVNGNFDGATSCFAESWLRATNNGEPSGAIGFYGSSINQSWAPPMEGQDEFNLLLTDPGEPYHTYGGLCFAASSSMMDAYGGSGVSMFNTWHIFGDPSLRVVGMMGPATGLRVSPNSAVIVEGPAGGPFAPNTIDFTLENLDETPLEYEVTTGDAWITVADGRGTLDPGATTVISLTINDRAANLDNGSHGASVQFVNRTDGNGDTDRGVSLIVGFPVLKTQWTLEEDPLWTTESKWGWGQPSGGGGDYAGYPDPTSGATGNNVFGFVLRGDYGPDMGGPFYLTSSPVDLSDTEGATLKFERWLNVEAMPHSTAMVEVSNDGSSWTEVWSNNTDVTESAWSLQHYDVSDVADGQSQVWFRWGLASYASATPCSGWNIDDVEVWGAQTGTARISLTVTPDSLSWTEVEGAVFYDVVRGDLETLSQTAGDFSLATETCVVNDVGGTLVDLSEIPPAGTGHWYLVRGVSTTGPMTFQALYDSQVGLRDPEIDAAIGTCP